MVSPDRTRRPRNDTSPLEEPDPPPSRPTNTMAEPGPARLSPPKPPKLPKFSGEGEDLKPNKLQRWFKTRRKTVAKSGITDDTLEVADWYGMYTEGAAQSAFQTLDDEYDNLTLDQFKA